MPRFLIDGFDRWYTSSAMVAWHRNKHQPVIFFALAYNRFTGYTPLAYEAAKKLGDNYFGYKYLSEIKYNEDYWRFTAGHNQLGNINIKLINPNLKLIQGQKSNLVT